jgi:hypothetical protein
VIDELARHLIKLEGLLPFVLGRAQTFAQPRATLKILTLGSLG